jgi:hypothetical protein
LKKYQEQKAVSGGLYISELMDIDDTKMSFLVKLETGEIIGDGIVNNADWFHRKLSTLAKCVDKPEPGQTVGVYLMSYNDKLDIRSFFDVRDILKLREM